MSTAVTTTGPLTVDGLPWTAYTELTAAEIADIRSRGAQCGPFVDPVLLRSHSARVNAAPRRWAHVVLGRPYLGSRTDSWSAFVTLALAVDAEPQPPADPVAALAAAAERQRAEAEHAAAEAERKALAVAWQQIRELLPVPVRVLYNYSGPLHTGAYHSGADHIVLCGDVTAGRLHRSARSALCASPSARQRQDFAYDSSPESDGDRVPTCRACIRTAAKLAGGHAAAAALLVGSSRRNTAVTGRR